MKQMACIRILRNLLKNRPYIKNVAFSDGVTLYQLNLFNWAKEELGGGRNKPAS